MAVLLEIRHLMLPEDTRLAMLQDIIKALLQLRMLVLKSDVDIQQFQDINLASVSGTSKTQRIS